MCTSASWATPRRTGLGTETVTQRHWICTDRSCCPAAAGRRCATSPSYSMGERSLCLPLSATTTISACSASAQQPHRMSVVTSALRPRLAARHHRRVAEARQTLIGVNGYTGELSHGATKSLYGADPDGNEFEMMWMLSRDASSSRTPPRSIGFTSPPSFSVGPRLHRRPHRRRRCDAMISMLSHRVSSRPAEWSAGFP